MKLRKSYLKTSLKELFDIDDHIINPQIPHFDESLTKCFHFRRSFVSENYVLKKELGGNLPFIDFQVFVSQNSQVVLDDGMEG